MSSDNPVAPGDLSTSASDYGERYFRCGLGLPYSESEPHWPSFFGTVAERVVQQLAPTTALDVGCATGFLVAALAERGVDAKGFDISDYAVAHAVEGARGRLWVQSLTEPIQGHWDVVTCIEVVEHMAPEEADRALDHICAVAKRVLFTSTPHDFNEATHVNVRPIASWIAEFGRRGFFRRTDLDTSYLSPWAVIVERRQLTPADVAHLYEVELAPLREEVVVKREALLRAEREITDLSRAHHTPSVEELAGVERVLALTDEVYGLRAQLAEAQYRHDRDVEAAETGHKEVQARLEEEETRRLEAETRLEAEHAVAEERRRNLVALEAAFADLEERAAALDQRLKAVLGSRTWRTTQAMLGPVDRLRRLKKRRT